MEQLQAQMASGELTEEEAWQVFNEIYDAEADLQNGLRGNQYSIETTPDGEKYVRADRQVIFGNDPATWGEQVENYINGKIRKGQDVQLTTEDGDTLTLTADTAGKAKFRYNPDGSRMSDAQYETKLNAETHIDELAAVSTRGNTRTDMDGQHSDFAKRGWNYRTAYFQDFDGTYYRLQISVAQGKNGNVVYNIGGIRKRDTSIDPGSSAKRGAQDGDVSTTNSIAGNTEFGKGKSSISEEENLSDLDRAQMAAMESLKEDAQRAETEKLRQALPVKARQYLARAERVLLANVQNALGVDKFSDKAGLMGTIQEISNEYLKHGKLTQERADALFEKAYKQGVVTEKEFYQRYKGIKDKLRTTAITLDEGYRSSIPDYRDFRQSAFGRLRLVNEGGMSVDSLYQELQQQAPELFPDSITNPANQLVQMFEVSKSIQISERTISESVGKDADEFKRWAKNDFESAVSDLASDLRSVSRYAQEQASKTQKMTAPTTPEEAMKAYGEPILGSPSLAVRILLPSGVKITISGCTSTSTVEGADWMATARRVPSGEIATEVLSP